MRRQMIQAAILCMALLPIKVSAQLRIDTGVYSTTETILTGIVDVLLLWSGVVTTAVFLIGALMMVASGGSDTYLSAGKKIMKAAAIGLAIILGSWMILSTVVFIIS
ncbi:MAG: hypothetical protein ABL890_04850 [Candidatus Peribacteraceae bacterium]